jgi:hypothetical protein
LRGLAYVSAVTMNDHLVAGAGDKVVRFWPSRAARAMVNVKDSSASEAQPRRFAATPWVQVPDASRPTFKSASGHYTGNWDANQRKYAVQRAGESNPFIVAPTNHAEPTTVTFSPRERFFVI